MTDTTMIDDTTAIPDAKTANYVVITPCRDEQDYLPRTIESIVNQTVRPVCWVIVDDGSEDRTPEIARQAAAEHPWIRLVQRPRRRDRRVGGGVVVAFEAGLDAVQDLDHEFFCKFDGDLAIGPRYFETLLDRFAADPRLGTLSGKCFWVRDGEHVQERTGDDFSLGAAKFYRRECFEQIGGFVHEVMWDGIDCHRCRMLGWRAASEHDDALQIHHLRQMGSSHKGVLHGRRRHGRGQWFMGSSPSYMIASAIYRMREKPYAIGGLNMFWGYFWAAMTGEQRYDDPAFRRHLRKWQAERLCPWMRRK